MNGVTEKFSVFDFFNLIISGIIFFLILILCHYQALKNQIENILIFSSKLSFSTIFVSVVCAVVLFSVGAVFQVISKWIIHDRIGWEQEIIKKCLIGDELIDNSVRREFLLAKAYDYLKINKKTQTTQLNYTQCEAFFIHCVYFLHNRNLDKKVEKLREAAGLSEVLTCVFGVTPILSMLIFILGPDINIYNDINIKFVNSIYIICWALAIMFYERYKMASQNRIRMTLGIYEACVDKKR